MNGTAWQYRLDHDDERLVELLRGTGDVDCLECAASFESAVTPEK